MDPLALLFGLLGAGGLAGLLKIILGYSSRTTATFQIALQEQRASYQKFLETQRQEFESFLGTHMDETVRALDNMVKATERLGDKLSSEHERTRQYMRDQASIVRDGHIKLAQLLQARSGTAATGRVLDEVMRDIEENGP